MDSLPLATQSYEAKVALILSAGGDAMGRAHLIYEPDDYFPSKADVKLREAPSRLRRDGESGFVRDTVPLNVGMTGILSVLAQDPNTWRVEESFAITIANVSDDEKRVLIDVLRPDNVPICPERVSIQQNPDYIKLADYRRLSEGSNSNPYPWKFLQFLVGLEIFQDIQLDDTTFIIRLSNADALEIRGLLRHKSPAVASPGKQVLSERITHAIVYREFTTLSEINASSKQILTALRLYKPGYLD
jgi:hypothetical protein